MAEKSKRIRLSENVVISQKQHDDLLRFITARLQFGNEIRDEMLDKFEQIDRELNGSIQLDQDDKKRDRDNKKGKSPKPVDTNLPLTLIQIDDAVTYALSILCPDGGMYQAITDSDRQEIAQGFARLMNEQAREFSHYTAYARSLRDMYTYNMGGLIVEWKILNRPQVANNPNGAIEINNEDQFVGNKLIPIDTYNFIWDWTTLPTKLYCEGEFFATVEAYTQFKIRKATNAKDMYGAEEFLKDADLTPANSSVRYLRQRPEIGVEGSTGDRSRGSQDFDSLLSQGNYQKIGGIWEKIDFYGWIIPSKYGLSTDDELQIWRIRLLTDGKIVNAEPLRNAHGQLPAVIGMPWDDGFDLHTRSYADLLLALNRFASFQMNTHQRAARKSLYGLTFYNSNMVDLEGVDDLLAGKIPVNLMGSDMDIRKVVHQITDVPDTANTLQDIKAIRDIMQAILPTDIINNITGLERATEYQAAATVQGSNRRGHKITKTTDDQAFAPARGMMYLNTREYAIEMEIIDENGNTTKISPKEIRDIKMKFSINDGLKGIDKLIVTQGLKEIIGMILQSQEQSKVDILKLVDYWTDLIGDKTDFTTFKYKSPMDALPPEQKEIAMQLLQNYIQQQKGGSQQNVV
jgi:hypothetical protein